MTFDNAIAIIQNEILCVTSKECGRECDKCQLAMPEKDILEAYYLAIGSMERLNAIWEGLVQNRDKTNR